MVRWCEEGMMKPFPCIVRYNLLLKSVVVVILFEIKSRLNVVKQGLITNFGAVQLLKKVVLLDTNHSLAFITTV